jgi:hypothetical protein
MIVKGWGGDLLINDKWWGKVLAVIENDWKLWSIFEIDVCMEWKKEKKETIDG